MLLQSPFSIHTATTIIQNTHSLITLRMRIHRLIVFFQFMRFFLVNQTTPIFIHQLLLQSMNTLLWGKNFKKDSFFWLSSPFSLLSKHFFSSRFQKIHNRCVCSSVSPLFTLIVHLQSFLINNPLPHSFLCQLQAFNASNIPANPHSNSSSHLDSH